MAFKIQSIEKMKNIATDMGSCATEAQSTTNMVIEDIDGMIRTVSGIGVDGTLRKLREAVSINTYEMIKLLNDVSTFINSQVSSYSSNEEDVSSTLNSVQSTLDSITI